MSRCCFGILILLTLFHQLQFFLLAFLLLLQFLQLACQPCLLVHLRNLDVDVAKKINEGNNEKQWKKTYGQHVKKKKISNRLSGGSASTRSRSPGAFFGCCCSGSRWSTGCSTGNHAKSSLTRLTSLKGQLSAINSKYCVQDNWNHMKGIEKEMQRKYFRKETIFVSLNNHIGFWMFRWWRWRGRRR